MGMFWQTFTICHFYLNQEEIAATYCINKDKPELNCRGACHLKEQLKNSTPDQQTTAQTTGITKTSLFIFSFTNSVVANQLLVESTNNSYFSTIKKPRQGYLQQLIDPPEVG